MSLRKYSKYTGAIARGAYKRGRVYGPAVKQLASDVMYLKGLINSEPKSWIVQSSNNVGWGGAVVSLCNIPTGDTSTSRDGDRILPRYLSLNISVGRASTAVNSHVTCRMIVFRAWIDNPAGSSGNISANEVLPSTVLSTQYAPLSHLNPTITGPRGDRTRRIEVLRNELFTFNAIDKANAIFHYNIEMNGKSTSKKEHIEYFSSTTGEPVSGGIYVLFVTDQSAATEFYYQMESKVTFYDN